MIERIDPEVAVSFLPANIRLSPHQTVPGFVSRNAGGFVSCPPYTIASVAERRVVPGAQLDLPEGYDQATLERIRAVTGFVGEDVPISYGQAEELAQIGGQILELNEQGSIQPPLNYFERQQVVHLLGLLASDRVV